MPEEKAPYPARRGEPAYISPYRRFLAAVIPNWLMERREISAGAKLLYARLAQHASKKDHCWPGQQALTEEMGVSERQLRRYISELETSTLIETKSRGMGHTQEYWFLEHEWMAGRPDRSVRSDRTDMADRRESRRESSSSDLSDERSSSSSSRTRADAREAPDPDDDDETPSFLDSLQELYSSLPVGFSNPITAPAKFFNSVRQNGSTIPRFPPATILRAAEIIRHALYRDGPQLVKFPHPAEAAGLDAVLAVIETHPKLTRCRERDHEKFYAYLRRCVIEFLSVDEDEEGGELNPDTVLTRLARRPEKLRQVIDLGQ